MTEMTALELAADLESVGVYTDVADMLRRQHEAIKVLRECLIDCLDDSRQVAEEYAAAYGNYRPERLAAMRKTVTDAEQALKDTEGL